MSKAEQQGPPQSLDEFAQKVKAERKRCYCDTLPPSVQQQLIDAPVSIAVARKWLISLGYEATGLESWRQAKRAERGGPRES